MKHIHIQEQVSWLSQNLACDIIKDTKKVISVVLHYLPQVTNSVPSAFSSSSHTSSSRAPSLGVNYYCKKKIYDLPLLLSA